MYKKAVPTWWWSFPSPQKCIIVCFITVTLTKTNLHFSNCVATVCSEPDIPSPRHCVVFLICYFLNSKGLLTLKLEDHSLLDVHNCLFSTFAATLHMWRPSPTSTTWCTMPWWQGAHLIWKEPIVRYPYLLVFVCFTSDMLEPSNFTQTCMKCAFIRYLKKKKNLLQTSRKDITQ